ncbi:uncharacterized protein G2W53_042979 [Senna tora]|uniref:Uncharacterized protein n=1 Tax=Senna tora TaxID=362788 RepID=A0A834VZE0_9FABA|nr:uncharacterized protein G2W53_042979 [Senna tora]
MVGGEKVIMFVLEKEKEKGKNGISIQNHSFFRQLGISVAVIQSNLHESKI